MAVSNRFSLTPGQWFDVSDSELRGRIMPQPPDGITERMLDEDVFTVPVAALIDIWVLRFGHSWVNLEDIERDAFFKLAYARLKSLGELEVHYLTDRAKYVCRKPE